MKLIEEIKMNDKDKIINTISNIEITGIPIKEIMGGMDMLNKIAELLVKANIGDISNYQQKVEAIEKDNKIKDLALDKATELAYEYRTEADTLSCSSCPMYYIFSSCKERGLYEDCSKRWKEELIRQSRQEVEGVESCV